jgi:hypothetical protein
MMECHSELGRRIAIVAITASVEIVLPAEDQQQFDIYYSRWLEYRRTNNRDEVVAMEKRMRDEMSRNNIPPDVPFDEIASRR